MMLRVVGGKYRSRKLDQPPLEITRPTKDVVKEAMFNSLGDISNKSFLDCFGGSGAIGIEAFSRGANSVTIIEKDIMAFKIIKKNLASLNISEIKVINDTLERFEVNNHDTYDYVFIDPPYKYEINNEFLLNLYKNGTINDKSIIIIERDEDLPDDYFLSYKVKKKKYGKTYLYILRTQV